MRRFLTGGIKAILAIAVLSTAAHWAMRVQREPASAALPVAALALILLFIGAKIIVADTLDLIHLPPWVSLLVTLVLLTFGVVYSLWRTRAAAEPENQKPPAEIAHRT